MEAKGGKKLVKLQKTIYQKILVDEGHFTFIAPLQRIQVAEHTFDLGEYLLKLYRANSVTPFSAPRPERLVYFAPCHQREQNVGQPYLELLRLIPGLSIEAIDGNLYCCGMAGIMGFKREFHEESLQIGQPLMDKIAKIEPDGIVTDCLSCRLQFQQTTRYPVFHPLEIMRQAHAKR
jgi:glycerol-3-phosphate dehydrogenase subunit C